MTLCRTIAEVEAAADADSAGEPPLSQEAADRVAAILSGRARVAVHTFPDVFRRALVRDLTWMRD